jgi:HSF-type DNA-binding
MLSPSPGPGSPKVHHHHHGALSGLSGAYAEAERSPLAPVSLSRQYSSERAHAHPPSSASQALAVNRHHPYASSPNTGSPSPLGFALGTSPNSAAAGPGTGLAYSPGNSASAIMIANTRQMHRRGSSLTGGAQLAGSAGSASGPYGVSPGATSFLSQSPRYGGLQTLSTRELPPGVYSDPPIGSFGSSSSRSPRGRVAAPQDSKAGALADEDETDDDIPSGSDETDEEEILEAEQDEEDGEVDDMRGIAKSRSSRRVSEQQNGAGRASSSSRRSTSRTRPPPKVAPGGSLDDGGDEGVEVAAIRERLGGAANCSAFISKLWYLMINPDMYSQYIRWSEAGDAIVISNDPDLSNEFAADVLPKLFKHGNNASFVRQLNVSASCLSREKLRC